jgi:hypothetical protein
MYKVLSGLEQTVWHNPKLLPYGVKVLLNPENGAQFCLIKWEV